jgi:hypothetical protein
MRSGREAVEKKMGGAWHCTARLRTEKSKPRHAPDTGTTAYTTGEAEMPCTEETCT